MLSSVDFIPSKKKDAVITDSVFLISTSHLQFMVSGKTFLSATVTCHSRIVPPASVPVLQGSWSQPGS